MNVVLYLKNLTTFRKATSVEAYEMVEVPR